MRSAPTTIAPILRSSIIAPAMLSEITVVGRPGFIRIHVDLLALFDSGANDPEGGAVSRRRERAGVAVCQHSARARDQRGAVAPHCLVRCDVFRVHALRLFNQIVLDLRDGPDAYALEFFLHSANRPEQIDGCGTRLADEVANLVEVALEVARRLGFGIIHAEGTAHRRRNADRRSPAHHHVADNVGHLLVRRAGDIHFFGRQVRLVDEAYALVSPLQSLNHESVVGRLSLDIPTLCAYAPRSGSAGYS